jgi:hypothetical protein
VNLYSDPSRFEFQEDGIQVEASVVADGLGIEASRILTLLRSGEITSLCERGLNDDEGRYRLTFFHRGKRLRLVLDVGGRLIRRSTIDFGDRPLPIGLRRASP